jgi:hypothetical protein
MPVNRTIRFPDDVYTALSDWAKEEDRPFQAHVIRLLRQAIDAHQRNSGQREGPTGQ